MLKRFVVDQLLEPLLPQSRLERFAVFLGRIIIRLKKPIIVSVTGSVGKSTTTALIAFMLAHEKAFPYVGRVGFTVSNMNDDLGVAATLLRFNGVLEIPWGYGSRLIFFIKVFLQFLKAFFSRYPRVMVLECGLGDTASLYRVAAIVPPTIAVVTRVGAAHIEKSGSLAAVVDEKGALVRAVPQEGLVLLGTEHPYVEDFEKMSRAPVKKFDGHGIELSRKIGAAVCEYFGVPAELVAAASTDFKAPDGRLTRVELGAMTVIDDTYNANPLSMRLGVETLVKWAGSGRRKIAVLGGMAELGEHSNQSHVEIGNYARQNTDFFVGVGSLARVYPVDVWFEDSDACAASIGEYLLDNDVILVKGSASVKMKKIVEGLRDKYSAQKEHA